jgi:hypothetical protein
VCIPKHKHTQSDNSVLEHHVLSHFGRMRVSPPSPQTHNDSDKGVLERYVFTHLDVNGSFERDFLWSGPCGISCMLTLERGRREGGKGAGGVEGGYVITGDDVGVVRMFGFARGGKGGGEDSGSKGGRRCTVSWEAAVEEVGRGEEEEEEAVTALLYVAELDQLVVASARGGVFVMDPWTGQRLARVVVVSFALTPKP